jgi:MOSC domain-containing protein YiiM
VRTKHQAVGLTAAPAAAFEGTVIAVAADRGHHFSKPLQRAIVMVEGHGIEGDAHAGAFIRHRHLARARPRLPNLRQVHLIPCELFGTLLAEGYDVGPGDLGENVTTAGVPLEKLPLGTRIRLGDDAVVELTGLRTPCALIDRFQCGLKRSLISDKTCVPRFKAGVLGVVTASGRVAAGNGLNVEMPEGPFMPLPQL